MDGNAVGDVCAQACACGRRLVGRARACKGVQEAQLTHGPFHTVMLPMVVCHIMHALELRLCVG